MTVLGLSLVAASGADTGKAAPFALFLVLALGVGIFFLARSMRKHLRRVPTTFEPAPPDDRTAPDPPQ